MFINIIVEEEEFIKNVFYHHKIFFLKASSEILNQFNQIYEMKVT